MVDPSELNAMLEPATDVCAQAIATKHEEADKETKQNRTKPEIRSIL